MLESVDAPNCLGFDLSLSAFFSKQEAKPKAPQPPANIVSQLVDQTEVNQDTPGAAKCRKCGEWRKKGEYNTQGRGKTFVCCKLCDNWDKRRQSAFQALGFSASSTELFTKDDLDQPRKKSLRLSATEIGKMAEHHVTMKRKQEKTIKKAPRYCLAIVVLETQLPLP